MYLCCMKNKQGEVRALEKLKETNETSFIPLIILQDVEEGALEKLKNSHSGLILLDLRELESEEVLLLNEILNDNSFDNFKIVYDSNQLLQEENDIGEETEYIKINPAEINSFFLLWLSENSERMPRNIILDFGYIGERNFNKDIEQTLRLANTISDRNLFILSGAVPGNLTDRKSVV